MDYAAIAAIAASLIGSLIGAGEDAKAQQVREQVLQNFGPDILPHLDRAVANTVQGTAFTGLREDDSLRSKQLEAIARLENVVDSEGRTQADIAANQLAQDSAAAGRMSDYASLQQSMAARGLAGSPVDFALKGAAAQGAANVAGRMGRQNAVDARGRALQAMEGIGTLAGNVRNADYRRLSDVASAQDRLNTMNNGIEREAQFHNLELAQKEFDNRMAQLTAQGNVANGVAAGYERGANAARQTAGGVGQGLITWGTQKEKEKNQ